WTRRGLGDVAGGSRPRSPARGPARWCSLGGESRPPAPRHKSGGWRVLSTPVDIALAGVEHPNGPEVWAGMLTELAGELQRVEIGTAGAGSAAGPDAELDDTGVPWVPRLGGRANLGPELARTARTGKWDRTRHAGRSEARMAILAAAASRGRRLAGG